MSKLKGYSLALGEIISAAWTAYSFVTTSDPTGTLGWRPSVLLGFAVFFILVIYHISFLSSQLTSKTPNVKMMNSNEKENPYVNLVGLQGVMHTRFVQSGKLPRNLTCSMAHVWIVNKPKSPTELNHANDLSAWVSYFDLHGNKVAGPFSGRWAGTSHPTQVDPGKREELKSIKLLSNGNPRAIDLFMQIRGEHEVYVFNNDSYFHRDWKDDSHRLDREKLRVQIELTGARVHRICNLLFFITKDGGIGITRWPSRGQRLATGIRRRFSRKNKKK